MTRSALQRTVVATKDLADQPEATYVLMLGPHALGVESWHVLKNGAMEFSDDNGRVVAVVPARAPFVLLRFDKIETMTSEVAERQMHEDEAALRGLREELRPEENGHGHAPRLPGQYA